MTKEELKRLKQEQINKLNEAQEKIKARILELVEAESELLFNEFKENRGKLSEEELNYNINNEKIMTLEGIERNIRKLALNKCNYFIWDLTFIDGVV